MIDRHENRHDSSDEFTIEKFMNPDPDRRKYFGRDPVVGQQEADRRLAVLPAIAQHSIVLETQLAIEPASLQPKGSAAVGMSSPGSDFDIAVVVQPGHIFTQRPDLWRQYQDHLAGIGGVDFKIEPTLVVEQGFENPIKDFFDLPKQDMSPSSAYAIDITLFKDLLGK
jgi:hypothetical protein